MKQISLCYFVIVDKLNLVETLRNDGRFKIVPTELDEDMLMYYIDMARSDMNNQAYVD